VRGYDGEFPNSLSAEEAEEYPRSDDMGVVRILQYAYLFMRRSKTRKIYFNFEADN
jgi:hypothetical protein